MSNTSNNGTGSPNMDPQTKHDIQSAGGQQSSSQQDMSDLGHKGGQAAQKSDTAHTFDHEDQSHESQPSSSKQDMSALGEKGGSAAHPQGQGLQNADEETREEVAHMGGSASHGGGRKND